MTTTNVQRGWRWPWTPEQLDAWLAKSRGTQGLPFFVEDPAVIARLLALEKALDRAADARANESDDDLAEAA
jgi:hypothetical protein